MCDLEEIRVQGNKLFEELLETCYSTVLIDLLPCSVIFSDKDGLIRGANNQSLSMFGYSHDELLCKTWQELTYFEDLHLSEVYSDMQTTSHQPLVYTIPKRYIDKHNNIHYCLTTISKISFGTINKVATIIDITEDKESWSFLYGEFRKKVS